MGFCNSPEFSWNKRIWENYKKKVIGFDQDNKLNFIILIIINKILKF